MRRSFLWQAAAVVTILVVLAVVACAKATPTPTPRPTSTATPVATATPTATPVPGAPTPTLTPRPTATPTPTVVAKKEAPAPKNAPGKVTIVVPAIGAFPGINSSGQNDELYRYGVTETFFDAKARGEWENPVLAESYEYAPDFSYVTIHLRQGVQFHKDWGEMTAEDAAWSMNDHNAYTNPTSIGQQAGDYAALFDAWEVVDKYTVKAPFLSFDPRWAAALLSVNGQASNVFSKEAYDANGNDWMISNIIGTGPFQAVDHKLHDRFVIEKVPYNHWRKNAEVDQITMLEVPEETAQLAMVRAGEVDIASFNVTHVTKLLEEGFKSFEFGGYFLGIFWAGNLWETTHAITGAPLDNSAVYARQYPWIAPPDNADRMEKARAARWAVATAIDREAINETVVGGLGYPISRMHINPGDPNYDSSWSITTDLAKAKEYLAASGNPDGYPLPIYSASGIPEGVAMADALTVQLRSMGSKMNVTAPHMDYTVYRPTVVSRTSVMPWITWYDQALTDWPLDFPMIPTATSITRGGFALGFEAPEIAQAFLETSKETDQAKRIEINKGVIEFLHHWQLATGIAAVPGIAVYNPKSIQDWPHPPDLRVGLHHLENIVPVK